MQPQDDRPLWDLLDHAPRPRVSGHFADDVLRRIRLEDERESNDSFGTWLAQSWKMMTGLAAGAALLVSMIVFQENHPVAAHLALDDTPEISALIASVPVNDLGELDTSLDDNELWLGTASY